MPTLELLSDRKKKYRYPKRPGYISDNDGRKIRQKVYSSARYQKVRQLKIQHTGGICEICELMGKSTAFQEVHHWYSFTHKVPEVFDRLAYGYDNLVCLCSKCHHEIHDLGGKFVGCHSLDDVKQRLIELKIIEKEISTDE